MLQAPAYFIKVLRSLLFLCCFCVQVDPRYTWRRLCYEVSAHRSFQHRSARTRLIRSYTRWADDWTTGGRAAWWIHIECRGGTAVPLLPLGVLPHENYTLRFIFSVLGDYYAYNGMKVSEIVSKYDIPFQTLYRWKARAQKADDASRLLLQRILMRWLHWPFCRYTGQFPSECVARQSLALALSSLLYFIITEGRSLPP